MKTTKLIPLLLAAGILLTGCSSNSSGVSTMPTRRAVDMSKGAVTAAPSTETEWSSLQQSASGTLSCGAKFILYTNGALRLYGGNITSVIKEDSVLSGKVSDIKSISFDSDVAQIGERACEGLTAITSLTIPSNVVSIGSFAFNGCTGITTVNISNGCSMGNNVFNGCSGLLNVEITCENIPDSAFASCTSLKTVVTGSNTRTIGAKAFSGCSALTTIKLYDSLISIGNSAFYGCTELA